MSGHQSFDNLRNETIMADMTDKQAMDDIAQWMVDVDPTLTGDLPEWVWDLVSLVDDLIDYTGRND